MKKNWIAPTAGLIALGFAFAAPIAKAATPAVPTSDFYVGGGVSFNRASSLGGRIDGALATQGFSSSSTASNTSTNPNLRFGYRINPNLAVEATYDRVGKMAVQSNVTSPAADTAAGQWGARGLGLHIIGIAPIDTQWSLYGRAGIEQWRTTMNLASTAGGTTSVSNATNNIALALGGGVSYAVSRNVDATAELTHYSRVGDSGTTGRSGLNQFSLGLRYHFM